MLQRCHLLRPVSSPLRRRRPIHSSAPSQTDGEVGAATDPTLLGRLTRLLLLHRFPAVSRLLSSSPLTHALLHAALRRVRLDPDAALHLFRLAPYCPSLLAHAQLLHILAHARRLPAARALVASLLSARSGSAAPSLFPHLAEVYRDFSFSAASFDLLLRAHADAGQLTDALHVFDEMGRFGCRRTLRSCNRLLNQLVQAGDVGTAVAVFEQMRCDGTLPDEFTVAIMAKAYCRDGRVTEAVVFVQDMERMGVEVNLVAYHAVMDGYCGVGQTEAARRILLSLESKGLSPNVVTYTLLVKAYCKEGRVEEAEKLLRDMRENEKIVVDEVAYGAVINGYCQRGRMEDANRVRSEMVGVGLQVNLFVYNTLINGYCKLGRMVEVEKLLQEMEDGGVSLDKYSYNTLVDGYCREGSMNKAFRTCDMMGKVDEANLVLQNLVGTDMIPDCSANTLDIGKVAHAIESVAGFVDVAFGLRDAMLGVGLTPDIVTYNSLIYGLCKSGNVPRAVSLFNKLHSKGMSPTAITYNTLIDGHCKYGYMEEAIKLLDQMIENNVDPNYVTYWTLIQGYVRCGNMKEISKLYNEMHIRGLLPEANFTGHVKHADPVMSSSGKSSWPEVLHWAVEPAMLQIKDDRPELSIDSLPVGTIPAPPGFQSDRVLVFFEEEEGGLQRVVVIPVVG
ncbi:hypothetical protein ZWY2020_016146 [Hordeum vulgare]|nr:hypothetical protein ZWY2020_016146 [Hordeum vulgare]